MRILHFVDHHRIFVILKRVKKENLEHRRRVYRRNLSGISLDWSGNSTSAPSLQHAALHGKNWSERFDHLWGDQFDQ